MVTRRTLVVLLLGLLTTGAGEAPASRDLHVDMFKHGLESFDYEKWREAAIFFTRALEANPDEGSIPDVQLYGHRWTPYLPHFFFGISLFETGQFSKAREQWALSREKVNALAGPKKRRNLELYKRRKSAQLGLTQRFFRQAYPRSFATVRRQLRTARDLLARIDRQRQRLLEPVELELELSQSTLDQIRARVDSLEVAYGADRQQDLTAGSEEYDRALATLVELEAESEAVRTAIPRLSRIHRSLEERSYAQLDESFPELPEESTSWRRGGSPGPLLHPAARLASTASGDEDVRTAQSQLSSYLLARTLIRNGDCHQIRKRAEPLLRHASRLKVDSPLVRAEFGSLLADFEPELQLARAYRKLGRIEEMEALRQDLERRGHPRHAEIAAFPPAGRGPAFPRTYALLIGAGGYRDPWPPLPGALDDIRAVAEVLAKRADYQVEVVEDPTSRDLRRALKKTEKALEEGDRMLVYYAGHGHAAKDWYGTPLGFVVPTDAPGVEDAEFPKVAYSMEKIRAWERSVMQPMHKLFIFDSCYSGMIFDDMTMSVDGEPAADGSGSTRGLALADPLAESPVSEIERKLETRVAVFISAGTRHQEVPDESIFRQVFVKALESEDPRFDANRDGYLFGFEELGPELSRRVKEGSGLEQHPRYGKSSETSDWVFRLLQRCAPERLPWEDPDTYRLEEVEDWNMAVQMLDFAGYLERYGDRGAFSELARIRLRRGQAPVATESGALAFQTAPAAAASVGPD